MRTETDSMSATTHQLTRHCCIEAKGDLAMHQSNEADPPGALENLNNRAFERLQRGFWMGS
jgi:hypothetical protein